MQRATLEHRFPFPFETLIDIREARYQHLEIWDMFSRADLLDEKDDGRVRRREYRLHIRTALPLFAQKLLANGEPLNCHEVTILDRKKREYLCETQLKLINSAIGFRERSVYLPDGTYRSKRNIAIETSVKVPGIGKLIEKLIVYEFREQSNLDYERILNFAKKRYGIAC
ncbi:MAG: hypothetical protein NZL89_00915 [Leptospiraceae bacterium]|nr:hypothetical protein [Leptospiraceae bacterium]